MHEIEIYPDTTSLFQAAATQFIALAHAAITAAGRFSVVLSGGSTPRGLYTLLATKAFAEQVNWQEVHVFWGDERSVPPNHADSNYQMAYEVLLRNLPLPARNVHRIHGEMEAPQAAAEYQYGLQTYFKQTGSSPFDLVLLGMGEDGHTASLFPSLSVKHENENHWVVACFVEKLETWRITLTPKALNAASNIIFLVTGSSKAERLQQVLQGTHQPNMLPAQSIVPESGKLLWMLDEAAAALLDERVSISDKGNHIESKGTNS